LHDATPRQAQVRRSDACIEQPHAFVVLIHCKFTMFAPRCLPQERNSVCSTSGAEGIC
jgi:hypothetical protein